MNKGLILMAATACSLSCASDYELKGAKPDVDPGDVTECDFTPISGTKISRYDCNPVFPEEGGADVGSIGFHVTEVLGHPFYQMWYGTSSGIEYAVSDNGTSWEKHPSSPIFGLLPGAWDQDSVGGQVVTWDPVDSQYVMSYQGINFNNNDWGIGITTSPDGVNWTKHPNNPVIDFADYQISDDDYLNWLLGGELSVKMSPCWPLTITLTERGSFRGYVAGSNSIESLEGSLQFPVQYPSCNIYSMDAMSIDNWIINDSQPILSGDPNGHDAGGVISASVVEFEDVLYMFYIGFESWVESTQYEGVISAVGSSLNLATSTDGGTTWTKDPGNPLPANLTDPCTTDDILNNTGCIEMSAIGAQVIGSRIHFWLTDNYSGNSAVGYYYYEPGLEQNH